MYAYNNVFLKNFIIFTFSYQLIYKPLGSRSTHYVSNLYKYTPNNQQRFLLTKSKYSDLERKVKNNITKSCNFESELRLLILSEFCAFF